MLLSILLKYLSNLNANSNLELVKTEDISSHLEKYGTPRLVLKETSKFKIQFLSSY